MNKDNEKILTDFCMELDASKGAAESLAILSRHAKEFDPDGSKFKKYKAQEIRENIEKNHEN